MVKVTVPATTANLGPGFDTMGMALDMYNTVEMAIHDSLVITVSGEGESDISLNETNIVYQAAKMVFDQVEQHCPGLRIHLHNEVPVARGLGSSAAAVVGGVVAANALLDNPLCEQELAELVTKIEGHPDNVLPALLGGVIVAGWGKDKLLYQKIVPGIQIEAVVAIPEFPLATKKAREVLPSTVSFQDALFNVNRASLLVTALITNNLQLLAEVMEDRLHQPYRCTLIPGMNEVIENAKAAGALGVVLSGAGPTILALTTDDSKQVQTVMKEVFEAHGVKCNIRVLKPILSGAKIDKS
ncbi:homoserine kinase [Desulfuribacillus stibiiarsenatis]|uniref:Homoserine kinase n=1 Tax=Desulfuribacillus stibiiarsenatis TaxID=1390249 RepID=A0A1E5L2U0_9FIRM|nr:homoserine kinase [Desulfuribacillus stibiiarsenatis]OEH84417.1 homoserine kinase [Desulfuribacillus stibiiarsenatis]